MKCLVSWNHFVTEMIHCKITLQAGHMFLHLKSITKGIHTSIGFKWLCIHQASFWPCPISSKGNISGKLFVVYVPCNIFFSNGTSEKINVPWIILQVYLNDVCSPGNKVICLNYILLTRKFLASIKKFRIALVEYFSNFILIIRLLRSSNKS